MTTFEIYDDAGGGFNMPPSAANGYVIADGGGTIGSLTYDDGSLAIFSVFNSPIFDEIAVTYKISGGFVTIFDIEYYKGNWTVLKILDLNVTGPIATFASGNIFLVEINTGDDYFGGNNYIDIIFAGPGNDMVEGYAGGDLISGDSGDDNLFGDNGNDSLFGGAGSDLLDGLRQKDSLWGGAGFDFFAFGKGYAKDVIKDFNIIDDGIFIDKGLVKNFKKLKKLADNYKGGVVIEFSKKDVLKIEDINKKELKYVDFDFFHF